MSPRILSDRELVADVLLELAALREQVAELGLRVERLAVLTGEDRGEHSRRVGVWRNCDAVDAFGRTCVRGRLHHGAHWYGGV